ncbi:MAG: DUF3466 family protein [Phycisphaerae bacterium]|nr:DUF3466 family protein [Tepidisphaeraceae bacterium]
MALLVTAPVAHAAPIYGGPTYDSATGTGYRSSALSVPVAPGSTAGNGTAVGYADKYSGGTDLGTRAVRLDASAAVATELGHLGTDSSGSTDSYAYAVNPAGTAVGFATKYTGGTSRGDRAVRWDAGNTVATELGNLGTSSSGYTISRAYAVNAAGTAVGYAQNLGDRAVRWDASGTAATELGHLGTRDDGVTSSRAHAVNAAGTAVGYADKYPGGTYSSLGYRAVRWDASSTLATELGNLGTRNNGTTHSVAYAVNAAGTTIGYAYKYSGDTSFGNRAVRWDASGTAATELGNLGTTSGGYTLSLACAINTAGTAVGYADKYSGGTDRGERAVRWGASGTLATELGNLGTSGGGITNSRAFAVNTDGTAVGYATKYSGGTNLGDRAVAWGADGVAIDLNTLLPPADQLLWTLTQARGISDTNWVSGFGAYDPDGAGGQAAYTRAFLIQVPEPAGLSLLALGGVTLFCRRRTRRA